MYTFDVFEVFPDGTLHDTNKSITCETAHPVSARDAVLRSYGFKSCYDHYYTARLGFGVDRIFVGYQFRDVFKDVWVLVLNNEQKEIDE